MNKQTNPICGIIKLGKEDSAKLLPVSVGAAEFDWPQLRLRWQLLMCNFFFSPVFLGLFFPQ